MGSGQSKHRRRRFLRTGLALGIGSMSGCMRMLGSSEQTTNAPKSPEKAEFRFDYDSSDRAVTIRFLGNAEIKAQKIEVRSSEGHSVSWPNLGSTSAHGEDVLEQGATATLSNKVLNWGNPVGKGETLHLVYNQTDGVTTLGRFSPPPSSKTVTTTVSQPEQSSQTTTSQGEEGFNDGFEIGSFDDNWSIVWFEDNPNGPRNILNDWDVVSSNSISGDYSLRLHSKSDYNAIATNEFVVDLSQDFEFSYSYYFEDSGSRGAKSSVLSIERNGSKEGTRIEKSHGKPLVAASRSPNSNEAEFVLFGNSASVDWEVFSPHESHKIRVVRDGDTIRGYHDDHEMLAISISDIEYDTSSPFRLMLHSSGDWGTESRIWFDDVKFRQG